MRRYLSWATLMILVFVVVMAFVAVSGCPSVESSKAIHVHLKCRTVVYPDDFSAERMPNESVHFAAVKNGIGGAWIDDRHLSNVTGPDGYCQFNVDYQFVDGEIIFFAASTNADMVETDFTNRRFTSPNIHDNPKGDPATLSNMGLWEPIMYDAARGMADANGDAYISRDLAINKDFGKMKALN